MKVSSNSEMVRGMALWNFFGALRELMLNLQTGPFQISQSHITHSGDDNGLGNCNLKQLLTYLSKVAAFRVIKAL